MKTHLPDLIIRHHKITNPDSSRWDLSQLVYEGGTKILIQRQNRNAKKKLELLPIKYHQVNIVKSIKDQIEAYLDLGNSPKSIESFVNYLKTMFGYFDEHSIQFYNENSVRKALYEYSEYQYQRAIMKSIKHQTAYDFINTISKHMNIIFENLKFNVNHTRVKGQKNSQRALGREAEKVMLDEARQLAKFCFDIVKNFNPLSLRLGLLPIIVEVNNYKVNLTPARKHTVEVEKDFTRTEAHLAFNLRVSAEVMIFLAMTIQNQAQVYNLRRTAFNYKPLGDKYEIREFKARRGGEVLFKIPKQYKPYFESYLSFIDEYAYDSKYLFPYLEKYVGFRKRTSDETHKFERLCSRYEIPWIKASAFRKIGENILMRLATDEITASDYANHAIATFRQSYEFPSLQRAMIEVANFWDKNDPLTHGKPKLSLFNSPCNGIPMPIDDATDKVSKPDCITPTGCIGCKHYRDEESFDYVWGLHSFRFLKIIESSSHLTTEVKPSNIAISWANLKIDWFISSKKTVHKQWVEEAGMRVVEGYYHPLWSRKIEKYER